MAAFTMTIAACNNSLGGFSGSVGNTPPTNPEVTFKVLGTVGTPFVLLISDTQASWTITGEVPLNVGIVNNNPPVRMIATKTANNGNLLSLEIVNGFTVQSLSSTSAPFGTVSIETNGGPLKIIAPPANPDLRIYMNGPFGERFQALVEDRNTAFAVSERGPAIFIFEHPDGAVDGNFQQLENLGNFQLVMTLNGGVVATQSGSPGAIIQQP